jgi:hypothetical protein
LDSHVIVLEINTLALLELLEDKFNEDDVEIFTTKMCVTIGGLDFEDALLHLENRDIKGTASQVIDGNDRVVGTVETICKGSGSRFINDAENLKAGNLTSILGGLTLGIVEVGGDGDDSVAKETVRENVPEDKERNLLDLLVCIRLSGCTHLREDHGRQLLRRLKKETKFSRCRCDDVEVFSTHIGLFLANVVNHDGGSTVGCGNNLEWPVRLLEKPAAEET